MKTKTVNIKTAILCFAICFVVNCFGQINDTTIYDMPDTFPEFKYKTETDSKPDSSYILTPEGIGKYLYELLLNRNDIRETLIAIDVNRLFPNEDLSKFNDSPAELILSILRGYQLQLPKSWEELLYCADSLNIDENSILLKSYFYQTHQEKYRCAIILKTKEQYYYSLVFDVLEWKGENYIIDIIPKIMDGTLRSLEREYLIRERFENLFDLNAHFSDYNKDKTYPYNTYPYNKTTNIKINNAFVPSLNPLIDKLIVSINEKTDCDCLYQEQSKNKIAKDWKTFIKSIKKNSYTNLQLHSTRLNNTLWAGSYSIRLNNTLRTDSYSAVLTFEMKLENKDYTFYFVVKLVDNDWKLIRIYPIKEKAEVEFLF